MGSTTFRGDSSIAEDATNSRPRAIPNDVGSQVISFQSYRARVPLAETDSQDTASDARVLAFPNPEDPRAKHLERFLRSVCLYCFADGVPNARYDVTSETVKRELNVYVYTDHLIDDGDLAYAMPIINEEVEQLQGHVDIRHEECRSVIAFTFPS